MSKEPIIDIEAVKDFIQSVGHDAGNCHTRILGAADLMVGDIDFIRARTQDARILQRLEELEKKRLKDIRLSGREAASIVGGAIAQFNSCPFSLVKQINEFLSIYADKVEGIETKLNFNADSLIDFPPKGLERILNNLFDNAIEAMEDQNIEEKWMGLSTTMNEKIVCLIAENPGQMLVSEPFARNASRKYQYREQKEGEPEHGFGLSHVRLLLTLYGGSASCKSEQGIVKFTLRFPRYFIESSE